MLYRPRGVNPTHHKRPENKILAWAHTPILPNYGTPRPAEVQFSAQGLGDPHSHRPKERVPAGTATRGTRATCSLAHGDCCNSPLFLSYPPPPFPPKALTCSTSGCSGDEGLLGVAGRAAASKVLAWWVTGPCDSNFKTLSRSRRAPKKGPSPHRPAEPPRRAGQSGAPLPQPAFSFKCSRSLRRPHPPSPAAPAEIRNWSSGERTGAPAATTGPSRLGGGGRALDLDPCLGLHLLAGLAGRQGPEALGMKSFSSSSSSSFKGSQTQNNPLDTHFGAVLRRAVVGKYRSLAKWSWRGRAQGLCAGCTKVKSVRSTS